MQDDDVEVQAAAARARAPRGRRRGRRPRAPRPRAASAAALVASASSPMASSRRWLTTSGLVARSCLRIELGRVARTQQRQPHLVGERLGLGDRQRLLGRSAKVTGTTCAGVRLLLLDLVAALRRPATPTSMMRGAGDDDLGLLGQLVAAGEGGDDVDERVGSILPATPVSASTMIAISRCPGASLGGGCSIPSWRIVSAGRSVPATRLTSCARSVSARRGAQWRGRRTVRTASSGTDSCACTGLASTSTSSLGSTCAAHVGDVARYQDEHAQETEGCEREQQDGSPLPRVHPVPYLRFESVRR